MPRTNYYVCKYGRYGRHTIVSYFMVSPSVIIKLDTFHRKMSSIAQSSWKQWYFPHRKRITKAKFAKHMAKFGVDQYLNNHRK